LLTSDRQNKEQNTNINVLIKNTMSEKPELLANNMIVAEGIDFVKPVINDNVNYREERKELIQKAVKQSYSNPLSVLEYFVKYMNHEGYDIEFELVFTVPKNHKVTITLPIIETEPKDKLGYYVNWDDETTHNNRVHTYEVADETKEYHVKFFGLGISGFGMQSLSLDDGYQKYLTKVISFGKLGHTFTSLEYAFNKCENNFTVPQALPSSITNISSMFRYCMAFNQPLSTWNTSNVTNMSSMFSWCINFNQPLNNWTVNNVTDMSCMFLKCTNFNQPLNAWNTSNVTDMSWIFGNCTNFNQPLTDWTVNNVTNMKAVFYYCTNFNQPLHAWNTSNVINMNGMFSGCTNFNQYLNDWNVYNVTNMSWMFGNCTNFNKSLSAWNTSNVKNMSYMFYNCTDFNQPLHDWNTFNVLDMNCIFYKCNISEQNKPIFKQQ